LIHLKNITPPRAPVTADTFAGLHADYQSFFANGRPDLSFAAKIRISRFPGRSPAIDDRNLFD
jgi:hypothetical protein